jgi:hypothetical protein
MTGVAWPDDDRGSVRTDHRFVVSVRSVEWLCIRRRAMEIGRSLSLKNWHSPVREIAHSENCLGLAEEILRFRREN